MMDAVRLALGKLSVLPVLPPGRVDRPTWGRAMILAPAVGAVLGGVAWVGGAGVAKLTSPLLGAVVVIAIDAVLTRGLHLDGLADVADGLGSRLPAEGARAVMKQSDIGPFGVVSLVLVLLLQVAALEHVLSSSSVLTGAVVIIGAAAVSRAAITTACRRGAAAAGDGLGAAAVGSVSVPACWLVAGAAVVVVAVAGSTGAALLPSSIAPLAALASGELWRRHCARRFEGATGDVLGAVQQVSATVFVLAAAFLV